MNGTKTKTGSFGARPCRALRLRLLSQGVSAQTQFVSHRAVRVVLTQPLKGESVNQAQRPIGQASPVTAPLFVSMTDNMHAEVEQLHQLVSQLEQSFDRLSQQAAPDSIPQPVPAQLTGATPASIEVRMDLLTSSLTSLHTRVRRLSEWATRLV